MVKEQQMVEAEYPLPATSTHEASGNLPQVATPTPSAAAQIISNTMQQSPQQLPPPQQQFVPDKPQTSEVKKRTSNRRPRAPKHLQPQYVPLQPPPLQYQPAPALAPPGFEPAARPTSGSDAVPFVPEVKPPQQQQPVLVVLKNPTTGQDETFMIMPEVTAAPAPAQITQPTEAAEGGSYKLLVRREKKLLFDEICEVAGRILQQPGGLLQSCIVVQCPEELLRRSDVVEVLENFTKAASERMGGDIQKVPLAGVKPEVPGQTSWSIVIEGIPPPTRDEAIRTHRLAPPLHPVVQNRFAPPGNQGGEGMVTISASQLQQLLAGRQFIA